MLLRVFLLLFSFSDFARSTDGDMSFETSLTILEDGRVATEQLEEAYQFSGLAAYFNNVQYYVVSESSIRELKESEDIELQNGDWLAIAGRFNVLLIRRSGAAFRFSEDSISAVNPETLNGDRSNVFLVTKPQLPTLSPELDQLRYVQLWRPLAHLARFSEYLIVFIQSNIATCWALSIFIFSVIVKILLLPVARLTKNSQDKANLLRAKLEPELAQIKRKYDGEEAHNKIMEAHRNLGISPFFSLKPMLITLVQLPILIVVFNALGEMPQFSGQSFLWIDDLASPDVVGFLPTSIPLLGDKLSLLPFLMSGLTFASIFLIDSRGLSDSAIRSQRINLGLMSVAFFILFYPFPSAMVLYWTVANFLQILAAGFRRVTPSRAS